MGRWLRGIAARARVAPLRFSLVTAVAILLLGATAYLGTASVLWYTRADDLKQTNTDLASELSTRMSANDDQADRIVELSESLDDVQSELVDEAYRKALMQDNQIVYREIAVVLKSCASERTEVVSTVQNRWMYILWTVHAYENSVTLACDPAVSALHEQIVGEPQ
jgi:hypothetical protein